MSKKLTSIVQFLNINNKVCVDYGKCGDIWQKISGMGLNPLPCMDISMDIIDERDYCGVDFSGTNKVCMLFFTGSCDDFPAIWIGNDDIERLDEMPIYLLDLSCDEYTFKLIGNFKYYIEILLNSFVSAYDQRDIYMDTAELMISEIKNFSDNIIDKHDYILLLK
jgi:hypothetical protein